MNDINSLRKSHGFFNVEERQFSGKERLITQSSKLLRTGDLINDKAGDNNYTENFSYECIPSHAHGDEYAKSHGNLKFDQTYKKIIEELNFGNSHRNMYMNNNGMSKDKSEQRLRLKALQSQLDEKRKQQRPKGFIEKLYETNFKYPNPEKGPVFSSIYERFATLKNHPFSGNEICKTTRAEKEKCAGVNSSDENYTRNKSNANRLKGHTLSFGTKDLTGLGNNNTRSTIAKMELLSLLDNNTNNNLTPRNSLLQSKKDFKGNTDVTLSKQKIFDSSKYPTDIVKRIKKKFPELVKPKLDSFVNLATKPENQKFSQMRSQIDTLFC